ncbi:MULTISPECIES: hypothetical protein [unclassified Streptomyces]|uniref:hypothetical protein n=1 Tax=unclassified Streptomyces TaxID=2593676 RepID=UPI002238EBAC|nr:hypothetical protein [Streptomyces sp. SHP 1-2]MCW5251599.1 hypothetical protein [Streptomyces sp. SHP 1-2]
MADGRRRLRSSTVVLGGMGVLAAALSACGSDPDRRCVDRDSYTYLRGYRVVADRYCGSGSSGGSKAGHQGGGSYAKGTGGGSRAVDGDWYYDSDVTAGWADDGTFSRSQAVDRGGFGCSGSGSGGG